MFKFKKINTPEEAVAIYKSIWNEVAEFEANETDENLAKSYTLAQEKTTKELSVRF